MIANRRSEINHHRPWFSIKSGARPSHLQLVRADPEKIPLIAIRMDTTPARDAQPLSRKFRAAWTAAVLAATTAPYIANYLRTPAGQSYTWIIPPYPNDAYGYRAWAQQAYDGRWLFSLKFTALPNPANIFLPFFLIAGKLARLTGLDIGLVFLLLKATGTALFAAAFFDFLRVWRLNRDAAAAASAFAACAAGAGVFMPWISPGGVPHQWMPVDAWLVDANTFWSLLWNPLFPFSLALILLAVSRAELATRDGDADAAWTCGAALALSALLHPYSLAVTLPLIAAMCAARGPGRKVRAWGPIAALALPTLAVVLYTVWRNPLLRVHNDIGTGPNVSMFALLAGFGFLPLIAAAGAVAGGEKFLRRHWPLAAWIALSMGLSQSPLWLHDKYVFGSHLALCILAAAALGPLLARYAWSPSPAARVALVLAAALPLTNAVHLREAVAEVDRNPDRDYRIGSGLSQALEFLRENTRREDVVFSDVSTSAKICALTGDTVVWGHWAQSVDALDRQQWISDALLQRTKVDRSMAFWNSGFDYLFLYGVTRDAFREPPNSDLLWGAEKIYSRDDAEIFRRPAERLFLNAGHQLSNSESSSGSPISRR